MNTPEHHLFVCGSFRTNGEAQGICYKKESHSLLSYLQSEIQDRMLDGVEIASTGCMNVCNKGPVMIDYPSGNWYGNLDEEAIDEILDAIEEGEICEKYLISEA
jgi:(2Fe-2S) ferredoxin